MFSIQSAKVCDKQEYCTNCPVRQNCDIRSIFYLPLTEYLERLRSANMTTIIFALSFGQDFLSVAATVDANCKKMDKKRQRELREHPTYSPN